MTETETAPPDAWWVAALANTLVWARLRVRDSGVAEVFDCDGATLIYDSEDTARAALMDADFQPFDGIDDDDAARMGFALADITPPTARDDDALRAQMLQALPTRD